ncbi:MAG TPA: CBS domain-containing protein [Steroidobacteraceae bacterium]|nr:CBS domain-containing protein [Steroidobacteraceae bacterium]
MNVADICSQRVVAVAVGASLSDAVALMYSERVGTVIVTRTVAGQPQVAGVLTDRDVVRTQLERAADFSQLSIADAMTHDPLVVHPGDDLMDVLRTLRGRRVRRAPVVDELGAPIGMISVDDLLQHIAAQISGLAAVVASQAGAAR